MSVFLLRALCALALSAGAALTLPSPAHAAAPAPQTQVPGVYRQAIGRLRVTALFDGTVALPRAQLANIPSQAIARLLDHRYVPENDKGLQTAVNAYLIQDGAHLTLVDTGTATCFGPGLGQVLANLRAAGYAPEQVDDVLLTHAHPDHLCGLLDTQGQPAYPNATVWLSAADAAYWLDPASEAGAPQMLRFAFPLARAAVAPYQATQRLRRFRPGDALPGGAVALDTHGHTPGHVSYRFDGGAGQQLLVWGDLVHYHAVQFAQPQAAYEADSDRDAAIAARKRMLAQAADHGWWVAGAHLPFPGLGHVRREGEAFAWVPAEFSPLPVAP
ncbi:glyoxylase-like metal-dependent hydrolase (beta-lactamase superfamily II) [Xanthomonas sacchari]|uniref:MBL fold metallo-hydrolase n=1 Tax=Xanthomonas sacchari TaxID=56458 RepID=UPI0027881330|nr:MBL fold metallo-hydrolase [Xanthomonas sacchari]MDQ1092002.1 glyoxylase-like metal-dependent hydrolase (beta-lactamase superfamily II) [Xanthomonas sacchari]